MSTSQIKNIRTKSLRANPKNVRVHRQKQLELIAESIKQFGFLAPVIVDENLYILAGHGRWLAAKLAGLKEVPVVIVSGLSDAEKRAYILADNKLVERAGWDNAALAVELSELSPLLSQVGLDIELTGFEAAEVDTLLGNQIDREDDPADDHPEVATEAISRSGDVWLLGKHRLGCGDARNPAHLRRLMGGARAAMVIADPPYNVSISSIQGRGKIKHRNFLAAAGEMSEAEFTRFLTESLSLASTFSADGSIHFVFMDWRHLPEILAAGKSVYTELKNVVVWAKTNAGQGSFYRSQYELIFAFKNGDEPHQNNVKLGQFGRNRSNLWTYPGVNSFRAGRLDDLAAHPTVKPVALIVDAMKDCTKRGDIVLDPFAGSGSTILAAERVGRRGYGLELDPLYVDVAIRRWQAFTKQDAILEGGRTTFDDVAKYRPSEKRRAAR